MRFLARSTAAAAMLSRSAVSAITLDVTSTDSVKAAASTVAGRMMDWYTGNQPGGTPGILPQPYYWWEAGAMMGTLIDYWYYTGDTKYNDEVSTALLFQLSPTYDFMPQNQTKDEGNDDQIFWAFAAMTAAEYKFPNPPSDQPSWTSQAQAVFNSQANRWDSQNCGGGLRWQIYQWNAGWDYKNSPSNAGLLNLASRLYAYTANETYADWTNKIWNWMDGVGLLSPQYAVFDGTSISDNCSTLDHNQWTYSAGMMLNAAATMYNVTQNETWHERALGIWKTSAADFFKNKVMFEICEPTNNCDTDQQSFKAYFARWMAESTKRLPELYDLVQPYLATSAQAAAAQCSGGDDKTTCGTKWTTNGVWDGTYGVGQQMCALSIIQANLIQDAASPVSEKTGGTSKGNASFGTGTDQTTPVTFDPITTADRAGAGILTVLVLVLTVSGAW
ncbi:glycoside hydrolase family 76 protein [Pseudocercospora fijiensis CIRAD86]|uniref:Mannan endo-1,6-alpha-mannosidase n=1 Tax=Pseudocercospora fijiensis (strain CIRAD86) TaxID=383855 RepID=M3ATW3_PSEFD|nr:glycoside hydrolase family 76 protein [Pseudocercospora fijiensis CIRAD86]EME80593.1 glycoside hydrolase family 76 protein [Pseudocercospora fijiensis CIRAD86]